MYSDQSEESRVPWPVDVAMYSRVQSAGGETGTYEMSSVAFSQIFRERKHY